VIVIIMKVIGWRIYYTDGTTYDSNMGVWSEAPCDGVQFVIEYMEDGTKNIHRGEDYYIYRDGTLMTPNNLRPFLIAIGFKFGEWTNHDNFAKIQEMANNDGGL